MFDVFAHAAESEIKERQCFHLRAQLVYLKFPEKKLVSFYLLYRAPCRYCRLSKTRHGCNNLKPVYHGYPSYTLRHASHWYLPWYQATMKRIWNRALQSVHPQRPLKAD